MDADGNGTVDLDEWLDNLRKCAGLAAALAESVNEAGVVEKFRSFEQQVTGQDRTDHRRTAHTSPRRRTVRAVC